MEAKIFKTIYFVRHGETDFNREMYLDADTPVSDRGREQAKFLAKHFRTVPVEKIVSSPYVRTRETAEIIRTETAHPDILFSELFRELERPSIVRGRKKSEPDVRKIMQEIVAHETDPAWHYSDEENLFDLETRARKAVEFLKNLPEKNILVVSHNTITRMMLLAMACSDPVETVRVYISVRYFMEGSNTGITIVDFGEKDGYIQWRLRVWNDVAHLGE